MPVVNASIGLVASHGWACHRPTPQNTCTVPIGRPTVNAPFGKSFSSRCSVDSRPTGRTSQEGDHHPRGQTRGCVPLLWPSDSRQRPFEVLASASGVGLFAGILDTFPGLDNAGHAAINRGSAERLFARFATETTAMGGPGIDSPERFAIKKKIGGGDPPSRDACRCRHQTERGAHEHLSPADMGCCVRRGSSSGRSLAGDHAGLGWHHLRHGERRQSGERQRHDRLRRRQ